MHVALNVHRAGASSDPRPATSRLGLSPRQLSTMAQDLEHYFQRQRPYLD